MAEPIRCAGCGRHYNPNFKRCPFCNAPTGVAQAPPIVPASNTQVICPTCHRSFNARLPRCPFCNAVRDEATLATAIPAGGVSVRLPLPTPTEASPVPRPRATTLPPGATLPDFAALAEEAIEAHSHLVPLEYHAAAVASLDAFFDATFGSRGIAPGDPDWRPTPNQRSSIIGLGAFLGELMRRELGGAWQPDPDQPGNVLAARLVLSGDLRVVPLSRMWHRLQRGAEESLEAFYRAARERLGRADSPAEIHGWVRQARRFAGAGRTDLAAAYLRRALTMGPDAALHRAITEEIAACDAAVLETAEREAAEHRWRRSTASHRQIVAPVAPAESAAPAEAAVPAPAPEGAPPATGAAAEPSQPAAPAAAALLGPPTDGS